MLNQANGINLSLSALNTCLKQMALRDDKLERARADGKPPERLQEITADADKKMNFTQSRLTTLLRKSLSGQSGKAAMLVTLRSDHSNESYHTLERAGIPKVAGTS